MQTRMYFFCFVIFLSRLVNSAKVLGIFPLVAYSHYKLGDTILKKLAARRHEVTVITPYAENKSIKNFNQIVVTGLIEEIEPIKDEHFLQLALMNVLHKIYWMDLVGFKMTETVLNHRNVQKLIKSNEIFDLVIIELFTNEPYRGFCHKYQAPCVILSTVGGYRWTNQQMRNPDLPSYIPDVHLNLSSHMNFWERFCNTLLYLFGTLFQYFYMFPKQNELLQKHFPGAPHLLDLYYNTSLILLNSHVAVNSPVPHVPNMIEIGGFHVSEPEKLPKDLQEFLDDAKDGAIFFSLGSIIKSKNLPKEKLDVILETLSKLKQKVLWKWEDHTLSGQPSNVKLGKWLPQHDILAHHNIKVFITHGGLLSITEAIYHGVTIVGIPIFADQQMNLVNAETAGYGIGVPYKSLSEVALRAALENVLNYSNYTENAKKRSRIFHDQQIKPLDKAMFWIEYVIRHKGAPHLKSAAMNLTWYQFMLLDVAVTVLFIVFICVFVLYKIAKVFYETRMPKNINQKKKKL